MPDGTVDYYIQNILSKLLTIRADLPADKQPIIDNIIDNDIAGIVEIERQHKQSRPHNESITSQSCIETITLAGICNQIDIRKHHSQDRQ